ncbi:hypothetical protein V7S43_010586 [Phytophthora oleae]|uniref:Uncharacterized protein n=1 Tax=Phytophthora oleae TaxID=2107226 RepID=A0ABD3FD86_9STRA
MDHIDNRVSALDFSANEQCMPYDEFDTLVQFIKAYKSVRSNVHSACRLEPVAVIEPIVF